MFKLFCVFQNNWSCKHSTSWTNRKPIRRRGTVSPEGRRLRREHRRQCRRGIGRGPWPHHRVAPTGWGRRRLWPGPSRTPTRCPCTRVARSTGPTFGAHPRKRWRRDRIELSEVECALFAEWSGKQKSHKILKSKHIKGMIAYHEEGSR